MSKRYFNTGSKKIRDHLNQNQQSLDSLLNYNLRGDGIIEVHHVAQGQTLRLNMSRLLQRIAVHSSGTATRTRNAFCKTDAPDADEIKCYLGTDETGEEVTVRCLINNGSSLMYASPFLKNGQEILVHRVGDEWISDGFNGAKFMPMGV